MQLQGILHPQYDDEPEILLLKNLENEYYRMQFLVDSENEQIKHEMEVSLQARDIVGELYDALYKQYDDPDSQESQQSLNALCVRLVYCLYANENLVIPRLDEHIVDLILHKASEDFDWSAISPTIFGTVFESTLNPETRRDLTK